jgi:hypothetical protein
MIRTIDSFFDSLQWDKINPVVDHIPIGKLMSMIDMNERWIYKGSETVPPCDTFALWQIPRRIYPIKQRHLDLYR